jgi:hypothetical protein
METSTATKLNITITVDAKEFVSAVLGSSFTTWSWWQEFKYVGDYGWNNPPTDHNLKFVKLGIVDPESYDTCDNYADMKIKRKSLSVNDIAKAFGKLVSEGYTLDPEDLDAIGGDAVMQTAVLGEVTYG